VRVDCYADPAAFWRDAQAFLERDEAGNTQVLAIASRHAVEPGDTPPLGFTIAAAGELLAAAMLTAKGTLFPTSADIAILDRLQQALAAGGHAVTDIVGERSTAQACAQLTGAMFRPHVGLRLYRLEAVNAVAAVPGAMRQATEADFDLLCAWQRAFFEDANVRESVDDIPHIVRRRLQTGGAWLWQDDGAPVAHAGYRLTPIRSVRIAPVYTPPARRGHGYATALMAELSRFLLAQGRAPLYLFADTDNPTANGVYLRAGFLPAGEHVHLTRAAEAA